MQCTAMIDTLAYAKKLIQAGMPEQQAEAQAQILAEVIDSSLATKVDLEKVKADLEFKMEKIRADLEFKMEKMRTDLELKIEQSKSSLIKWMAGLLIAQSAVVVTLIELLK